MGVCHILQKNVINTSGKVSCMDKSHTTSTPVRSYVERNILFSKTETETEQARVSLNLK